MDKFLNSQKQQIYDLEERTIKFSGEIINFVRKVKKDFINESILRQLIRCGTSIGANYCEANGASSKRDFRNKIYICKRESHETTYWLQLLAKTNFDLKVELRKLWQEAKELTLIFSKIIRSLNQKNDKKDK